MLSNTDEEDRNVRRMYHANQCTDHISNSVTLRNDEAVKRPSTAERSVEVSGLSNRICSNQGLEEVSELLTCQNYSRDLTSPTIRILSGFANLANFSREDIRRYELSARKHTGFNQPVHT
jgi:hypothetical protein